MTDPAIRLRNRHIIHIGQSAHNRLTGSTGIPMPKPSYTLPLFVGTIKCKNIGHVSNKAKGALIGKKPRELID